MQLVTCTPFHNEQAFDTNLLVSLAVNDDPNQAEIAEHLLDTQQVFVPRAVLLGTE
uniref:PIN domain-containing protein n=1 Tax=Candidatus Kentrum sp. LPFa TaxID=2126335 RepID=A0A450WE38_9GAMM|nr:MAG: hypothetical protein BECKLPF1236B_GA0070989_10754 [Candidatus Kentron sp. LPFa]